MIRINEIKMPLNHSTDDLKDKVVKTLKIDLSDLSDITLAKKSVDARKKDNIVFIYNIDCTLNINEDEVLKRLQSNSKISKSEVYEYVMPENKRISKFRPVIVGFGPAGMLCGLMLSRVGLKPLILERGSEVSKRKEDIDNFWSERKLNTESNIQFGEGGAGTFSDGKLTTGIKDKRCRQVFIEFRNHGAPEDIMYSATPHIGTDKLPGVVKNIREEIKALGGEVLFNTKLEDIIVANNYIHGITYKKDGKLIDFETDTLIIATGHSARDTVEMLYSHGIKMMRKAFSIGVRIEHPREFINKSQYGTQYNNKNLETASYKMACHPPNGRGLYTFCMCPGGTVVMASSEENACCVNGMSEYNRDKENSNSALLFGIEPEDFEGESIFAGVELQRKLEHDAFVLGGKTYAAPAQKVGDFMKSQKSTSIGCVKPSCPTGVEMTDITPLFPTKVIDNLKRGLSGMDRKLNGFLMDDAILTAPEARSSSPVRIVRDEYYQTNIGGIYPCGEGAGYAGGIVSAAADGIKCFEAVISDEHNF